MKLDIGPIHVEEYTIYVDNHSLRLVDTGCFQCKERYFDIEFSGYVETESNFRLLENGRFCGRDSNCTCEPTINQIEIRVDNTYECDDWQFLHYYIDNGKLACALLPLLRSKSFEGLRMSEESCLVPACPVKLCGSSLCSGHVQEYIHVLMKIIRVCESVARLIASFA